MRYWIASVAVIVGILGAVPESQEAQLQRGLPRFRVTSIHDGDTATGDVLFPFGVALIDEQVRFDGYDAWEVARGRGGVVVTDEELAKGQEARASLASLLKSADSVFVVPGQGKGERSFGRLIARVYVAKDGKVIDVAEWMTERKHVRK